ncbi:MAG: hypothetical protein AB7L09_02265 [Nitrospira sp.]
MPSRPFEDVMEPRHLTEEETALGIELLSRVKRLWETFHPEAYVSFRIEDHAFIAGYAGLFTVHGPLPGRHLVFSGHVEAHAYSRHSSQIIMIDKIHCRDVVMPILDRILVLHELADL